MDGSGSGSSRLFFALVPDAETRRRIGDLRKSCGFRGRTVPLARLHATLAFLGQQSCHHIAALKEFAGGVEFPRAEIQLNRLGGFERARVGWVGTDRVPESLVEFRADLVSRLEQGGISVDGKRWVFHITLYRDLRIPCPTMSVDPVNWAVNEFVLMESVTGPDGLRYRERGRWSTRPGRGTGAGA